MLYSIRCPVRPRLLLVVLSHFLFSFSKGVRMHNMPYELPYGDALCLKRHLANAKNENTLLPASLERRTLPISDSSLMIAWQHRAWSSRQYHCAVIAIIQQVFDRNNLRQHLVENVSLIPDETVCENLKQAQLMTQQPVQCSQPAIIVFILIVLKLPASSRTALSLTLHFTQTQERPAQA